MKEQNPVLTETEAPSRGPRAGQGCDTDKWCLCKAGRFSYGESPRTPPLEGNSLHRRNNRVERPWAILSLFTTCLPVIQSPCHRLWHMLPTPGKAQWEESRHRKCGQEQNHSEQELGRRKGETRLKKPSLQIWYHAKKQNEQYHYEEDLVEQKAPGKVQVRSNEKQPYNVPTTTEPERRRPKKKPEKKHPTTKNTPSKC